MQCQASNAHIIERLFSRSLKDELEILKIEDSDFQRRLVLMEALISGKILPLKSGNGKAQSKLDRD